jgi:hypothetical protein
MDCLNFVLVDPPASAQALAESRARAQSLQQTRFVPGTTMKAFKEGIQQDLGPRSFAHPVVTLLQESTEASKQGIAKFLELASLQLHPLQRKVVANGFKPYRCNSCVDRPTCRACKQVLKGLVIQVLS